jgi:hypothetical protein
MVPITLDGRQFHGVVTSDGFGLRVKVAADEFERLGLVPGRPVRFDGAGREGKYFLSTAEPEPPFVWLVLLPMAF